MLPYWTKRFFLPEAALKTALAALLGLSVASASAAQVADEPQETETLSQRIKREAIETATGIESFFGIKFHGRRTASGVIFDKDQLVAAHPFYPFGTLVRVINLANQRAVYVRIVDRGPGKGPRARGVIIDLSRGAAEKLGFVRKGKTETRLEVVEWGDGKK